MANVESISRTPAASAAAVGRILLAHLRQRGARWVLLAVVAIGVLVPAGVALLAPGGPASMRKATLVGIGALGVLLLLEYGVIAASVLAQNQPVAARLVPGHVRALRAAMAIGWSGAVLCATAIVAPLLARQLGSPPGLSIAVMAAAAVLALAIAAAARWRVVWILGCTLPSLVSGVALSSDGPALWDAGVALWRSAGWPIALATTLACAFANVALVQSGGAAHVRAYALRQERLARLRLRRKGMSADTPAAGGGLFCRIARWRQRAYYAWMRRLVDRGGAAMPRVMLVLGPAAHWTTHVASLGLLIGAVTVACVAAKLFASAVFASALVGGFVAGVTFPSAVPMLQIGARLHQTRREQALLVLLPGVPRGAALNRGLSMCATQYFVLAWLLAVAVIAVGGWVASLLGFEASTAVFRQLSLLMAISLWLVAAPALWRHWARVAPPTPASNAWISIVPAAAAAGAWTLELYDMASTVDIAVVVIGASIGWCALRWIRTKREPTAFPVGRLRA